MLVALMIVVPLGIAVFFGLFAFRGRSPFVFHCRRCDRAFRGPAERGYPRSCPHCGSRDWNLEGSG